MLKGPAWKQKRGTAYAMPRRLLPFRLLLIVWGLVPLAGGLLVSLVHLICQASERAALVVGRWCRAIEGPCGRLLAVALLPLIAEGAGHVYTST